MSPSKLKQYLRKNDWVEYWSPEYSCKVSRTLLARSRCGVPVIAAFSRQTVPVLKTHMLLSGSTTWSLETFPSAGQGLPHVVYHIWDGRTAYVTDEDVIT